MKREKPIGGAASYYVDMRLLFIGLTAAAALALTGVSAGAPPPAVSFSLLPTGWHAAQASNGAYALSWRYREDRFGWAGSMPKNGIAVEVSFFPKQSSRYPVLRLVLPKTPATTLEGAPDTPQYRIRGRVQGRNVDIWVSIRRHKPTVAQLRAAQRVVSGIRFTNSS